MVWGGYKERDETRIFEKAVDALTGREERADALEALRQHLEYKANVSTGLSDAQLQTVANFYLQQLRFYQVMLKPNSLWEILVGRQEDPRALAWEDTQQMMHALLGLKSQELALTNQSIARISEQLRTHQISAEQRERVVQTLQALGGEAERDED